jgi:hypothetical protein
MPEATNRPRIGFLGMGAQEIQLLLELCAGEAIEVVGVYDQDPRSPGLAIAAVVGVPAGSDTAMLERLRAADFVVLPEDRQSDPAAVQWAAGLHAELVSLAEARQRWAALRVAPGPAADPGTAERTLAAAVDASSRLQDRAELGNWLLGVAMRSVGANGGSIQLVATETSELYLLAARGLSERLVRLGRHRVGEGVSGTVAATGTPQILHGPRDGRPGRERGEVHASISLPLEDGELLGVLNVSSTVRGRIFGEDHLRALERLAPRITRLLRDASRFEPGLPRLDVPRLLRLTEPNALDLPARFRSLCERAATTLGAESATVYLSTDDGEWLRVCETTSAADPATDAARRTEIEAAFVERRWVHVSGTGPRHDDAVAAAVERAFEPSTTDPTRLVCPLEGVDRVGVLVLEFESLEASDRCWRTGGAAVDQLGFCVDALLREHRQQRRIAGYAALTRSLQRLLAVQGAEAFDRAVATEAAKLVGARAVSVRRVDEVERTYSPPVVVGTPPGSDSWRHLDARVTERAIMARHALASTVTAGIDDQHAVVEVPCSLLSVPFEHAGSIVAVLNAYEKVPRDALEPRIFSDPDRQLLESLALVTARLAASRPAPALKFADDAGHQLVASPAAPARGAIQEPPPPAPRVAIPPPQPAPSRVAVAQPPPAPSSTAVPLPTAPPARAGTTPSAPMRLPRLSATPPPPPLPPPISPGLLAPPQRFPGEPAASSPPLSTAPPAAPAATADPPVASGSSPTLEAALSRALGDAATAERGVGVWVLHFAGLAGLGDAGAEVRPRLASTVRLGLRGDDVVEWTGDEELTILGPGLPPANRRLETRLGELVRPQLARLARVIESGVELRIGASAFPQDGREPRELLAAAAGRAR